MDYREHLTITPGVRSGQVCIKGTRMTVTDIFDYLGGGMSVAEVLDDFPHLTAKDIQACFAYASDRERRMQIMPLVPPVALTKPEPAPKLPEAAPDVPHEAVV